MSESAIKFGTDGWRGIIAEDFTSFDYYAPEGQRFHDIKLIRRREQTKSMSKI